jgi:TetR/AcrR family transcriptional regulator, regulator of cefoperazone and chloramphenicol sensitivity
MVKPLRFFLPEHAAGWVLKMTVTFTEHLTKQKVSSTKEKIFFVAERLFAERGFGDVSSKEICKQANVNSAAINYYFGGKKALYEEVLAKAQRQNTWSIFFDSTCTADLTAEKKLETFFQKMLESARTPEFRIILREIAFTPSALFTDSILESELIQIRYRISEIVHSICGLEMGSDEMERATALVILPLLALILEPELMRLLDFPSSMKSDDLAENMLAYALGGIIALKKSQEF